VPIATTIAANQQSSHSDGKSGEFIPRMTVAANSISPVRTTVSTAAMTHFEIRV